jgi:hypothetical protein
MQALTRTVEEKLALMADAQHGVVTRVQLLRAGVTRQEMASRLKRGALIRVHRRVYLGRCVGWRRGRGPE